MEDAMVTGRMPQRKKAAGNAVLQDAGLNASQAINRMYARLIEERSASFLRPHDDAIEDDPTRWAAAAAFVDSLPLPSAMRFDGMTDAEIRMERLCARGLM